MKLKSIFSLTLLMLMCGTVCSLFAKAPTTPKILFTSSRDGNREIYMMNPDGSEQVNLTQHRAEDMSAVWSPRGDKILFVSNRQGTGVRDLYLMNPDGSNVRRVFKKKQRVGENVRHGLRMASSLLTITGTGIVESSATILGRLAKKMPNFSRMRVGPAWSPDGSEIACSISHQFGARLTFINVRTRKLEQPLPDKALQWQSNPSWSAAGDRLAIRGNRHLLPVIAGKGLDEARALHNAWADKDTIFIVNRDGTGLRQLVEEAGPGALGPALSPDGLEVLYTQEINGHSQIFKVDVNTGVRTQLTHIAGPFRQTNSGGDWFDPAYALPVSPQPTLLTATWGQLKKKNPNGRK